MKKKLIVGAAIGDCVHVAGVVNFLNLAEELGYETICLGPAVSVDAASSKRSRPSIPPLWPWGIV